MEVKNADYANSSFWHSFRGYMASFPNPRKAALKIQKDLGLKRTTVRDWTMGKKPRLAGYIPLGYYLVELGYSIPEFENLPDVFRQLGEDLRGKKYLIEDILRMVSIDGRLLMAVFCGVATLSDSQLYKLQEVVLTKPVLHVKQSGLEQDAYIPKLLAVILKSAQPLIEYLSSDNCHENDRRALRENMGHDIFFKLTTDLYKLVGERSRKSIMSEERQ